jgi:hypothetical protein
MLKNLFKFFILIFLIFASWQSATAQKIVTIQEKDIREFIKLLDSQKENLILDKERLAQLVGGELTLDSHPWTWDADLGFGYTRLSAGISFGTFHVPTKVILENGNPLWLKFDIELNRYRETNPKEVDILLSNWGDLGSSYKDDQGREHITYEVFKKGGFKQWDEILAQELGAQIPIKVSDSVKSQYEFLMSPFERLVYGESCGVDPIPPKGYSETQVLVSQNEDNLLRNVLRGPNPEGRIYAAFALIDLDEKKKILSEKDISTIKKVLNSKISVSKCRRCEMRKKSVSEVLTQESETKGYLKKYIDLKI